MVRYRPHDLEVPGPGSVDLQSVRREGNSVPDVPAVFLADVRGDQRAVAGAPERREVLGQYLEDFWNKRQPQIGRLQCQHEYRLSRPLIGAKETVGEGHTFHAGDRPESIEVGEGQRRSAEIGRTDEQYVGARIGNGPLHARLHALQNTKQGEGHRHLHEDQRRAPRLAPDAGPDEGKVFHFLQNTPQSIKLQGAARNWDEWWE